SMFAEQHERFVYITPYLKEAEKAVADMIAAGAQDVELVKDKDLEQRKGMRKRDHLYELLMQGKSAVGSHRLFEVLNPHTMSMIELGRYILVIDEATQWVKKFSEEESGLKASELGLLFRTGHAYLDGDLNVCWNDDAQDVDGKLNESDTAYSAFRALCLQK